MSDPTTTDDALADPETETLIIEDEAVEVPDEDRVVPEDANTYVPEDAGFNEDGGKP